MDVREVDVTALAEALGQDAPVIDVREPDEFAAGHIAGARNVPLGDLEQRLEEFRGHGPVYLVCAVGMRSHAAAEALVRSGVPAVNVAGGMQAWITAGHPVDGGGAA
jgi:rhodanese-related sulfurtransferase